MAYFECIIGSGSATAIPLIVTCSSGFAGTTITASKTGARTQTQTCPSSSPYEVTFILPEDGTWIISGVVSGQTFSETLTILPYEANLNDIPNGSTVTPTGDIQIWLHCANIFDKSYTTITQVLNDASTLQALIASNNAVDYMERSTTWASNVVADSSAMSYIGLNDYCANKLLANSTWLNAICNSTYFESVLNVKVPTMTSNTTPYGIALASGQHISQEAYRAFDSNTSTYWANTSGTLGWIAYMFTQAVKVYKIVANSGNSSVLNWRARYSDNGSTWTDISGSEFYTSPSAHEATKVISPPSSHEYWGINCYSAGTAGTTASASSINFYGRASS